MRKREQPCRKRSESGAVAKVSLFPFMAVLLCTMGALILLLVIISRTARERALLAEQEKRSVEILEGDVNLEEFETVLVKLREEKENADWLINGLRGANEEDRKTLQEKRDQLTVLDEQIRKLRETTEQMKESIDTLLSGKNETDPTVTELEKSLKEKEKLLAEKLDKIEKLKKSDAEKKTAYAIVPYRGRKGTQRYPIYIVCNKDSITIEPEGIELLPIDFAAAGIQRGAHLNPLDAAIRAATVYLIETGRITSGEDAYPLIIGKPSSIESYGVVWQFLNKSGNDFGYELIDEDQEIAFPQASAELKNRMQGQIEKTRNEIGILFEMLAAGSARSPKGDGNSNLYRAGPNGRPVLIEDKADFSDSWVYRARDPRTVAGQKALADEARNVGNGSNIASNGLPVGTVGLAGTQGRGTASERALALAGGGTGELYGLNHGGDPSGMNNMNIINNMPGQSENFVPGGMNTARNVAPNGTEPVGGIAPSGAPQNGNVVSGNSSGGTVGEDCGDQAGVGSIEFNAGDKNKSENAGKNVGNMRNVIETNGIKRVIHVRLEPEKLVIPRQTGSNRVDTVPLKTPIGESYGLFAGKLKEHIEDWGLAGERRYWQPILKVTVSAGNEHVFEHFKRNFESIGFIVEKE